MAKKSPRKPSSSAEDGRTLRLKKGEAVEFPVSAKHPYARFQTLTPVRSGKDIPDFLSLWDRVAAAREHPPATPAVLVAELKKAKVQVLRVAAFDLVIPKGATVVLNNPLNQLQFDSANVAGDLISRGELVFRCNTLSI